MNDTAERYCPKCGLFSNRGENSCEYCKTALLDTGLTVDYINAMTPRQGELWRVEFQESVIKASPEYSPAVAEMRSKWQQTQLKLKLGMLGNTIRCPRCNSTDFQMVQRKWSMITGLLTNKVDRVCTNCKRRF